MKSKKEPAIEAEAVDDVRGIAPTEDGQYVLIKAVIKGRERIFALGQDEAMATGLQLMYSALECQRILSDNEPVSILLPGFDIGVALSEQGTLVLHIVTANDMTMAFQLDIGHVASLQSQLAKAETLLRSSPAEGAKMN